MTKLRSQSEDLQTGTRSRAHALRDTLIVGSPIIILGMVGNLVGAATLAGGAIINLGYAVMILVGAKLLQHQGTGWREIGLRKPATWPATVLLGIAAALGAITLFVATQVILMGLLQVLGVSPPELDQSRFNPIMGNVPLFVLMIVLAWTIIAFGEELFYRAFLITRMVDVAKMRSGTAILIAGGIFGAIHFAEGPVGILANTSFGILFGWIYIRSSRNLWITIVAHGLINTLRFTLLFVGAA
jgi:membrane protease YdiL (CAAX protease family)